MKVTIIGGAGARVPLLTNGMLRFDNQLRTSQLALWDIDDEKRRMIARVSRAMAERHGKSLSISLPETLEEALDGARFVICSIRVGGTAGRIKDETIALRHSSLGQETVGAGGFCLALRTIPAMVEYARQVARLAPDAWLLNFTNPVGVIAQAMNQAGVGQRTIGICDTPREQFEHLAQALDVSLDEAFFDYLGLNHLGWIRKVLVDGRDRMPELFNAPEKLSKVYRLPLFPNDFLQRLGLFPTEYLYYYYFPDKARLQTASGGSTRGQLIQGLERELARSVQEGPNDVDSVLGAYDRYLASRNASYMTLETGRSVSEEQIASARRHLYEGAAGYDRIAIDVMRAIRSHTPTMMPVDVANQGAIEDFEPHDAVEAPCMIDGNGARPLACGRLPNQVRELALRVKEYERLTARAAMERSMATAEDALAGNPILESRGQARAILADYKSAHAPHLDYLKP